MSNPARLVVFTGNLAYSVVKGIVEIDRANPGARWLIVVHAPVKTLGLLLRNQWHNLRRNGWRWLPYQTVELWQRMHSRTGPALTENLRSREYEMSSLKNLENVRLLEVDAMHAESTLEAVRDFRPDLGIALAAPILRRPLFSIPRLGTINLHKGKVPDYRGMPPAFWELWNDEQCVGCTVHWVDDKLDTGDIAVEGTLERERYSTVRGLQLRLDEMGVDLTREAVTAILHSRVRPSPQPPGGKTFRKPSLTEVSLLDRMLMRQQNLKARRFKQLAKDLSCQTAFSLYRGGLVNALKPRITVLLYHRVSDSARDNLTVGIEQFNRHMALLRKHCQLLSIEEALSLQTIPKTGKPLVCVTFDDGYLDNYLNAAPILLRHGVPAAFFVTTGIIGTDKRFPHDVRRGNPGIPVMTWEQLRAMRDQGFTIGSHTVSHIDCAAEPEQVVWDELVRSRQDIERELGLKKQLFAYPYGGRENMTAQRLDLVKKAGYDGCLSAYGGVNIGTVDPFNVLRRGIHWEFSDAAILAACLGIR